MEDDQQFCLRWNNHQSTLISVFDTLLENGTLVDCTLAAEGKFLKAHKVVLSACSPYFATLLTQQYDKHPVFILKDVKFQELRAMMDYMYRGEVNISQDQLAALLRAAESLQIKGLSDNRGGGGGGGGSSSSGGDSGSKSENAQKPIPVPVVSKPGLTIEQKRPNKHPAIDADLCESREGSTSPTSRKRKKIRRRSTETNNLVDNHDQLSNSSSQSMPHHHQQQQQQQQTKHMTSSVAPLPQITSATSAANVLNVTKKTDIHEPKKELDQSMQQEVADDDDDDDDQNEVQEQPVRRMKTQHHDIDMSHLKEKMESTHSELLIEPKSEYDDGNDETVEDLTLDEEELLEDLDQAGPSHGGEGSSQGYAQWQVDRSQDEVFLAAQEAAGQHRDAQDAADKLESALDTTKSDELQKQQQTEVQILQSVLPHQMDVDLSDSQQTKQLQELQPVPELVQLSQQQEIPQSTQIQNIELPQLTQIPQLTQLVSKSMSPKTLPTISTTSSFAKVTFVPSRPTAQSKTIVNQPYKILIATKPTHPQRLKYSDTKILSNEGSAIGNQNVVKAEETGTAIKTITQTQLNSNIGLTCLLTPISKGISNPGGSQISTPITLPISMPITIPISNQLTLPITLPVSTTITPKAEIQTLKQQCSSNISSASPSADSSCIKYADIDDIEMPDGSKIGYPSEIELKRLQEGDISTLAEKYSMLAASTLKNFDMSSSNNESKDAESEDSVELYACRHCNKRYRWKSTLRRHENDECGNKEPSHQCPYCQYKAKQRGNLGVHLRKHHKELPQLESRRKKRPSMV